MSEGNGAPARGATPPPPRLTVGSLVSGGRYELLEAHGGVAGQSFWHARDKRLRRDVALTFIDPLPGEEPPGSATGVLDRTVALTGVTSDGLARVLDVIRGRAGGIVISEWSPGRSLAAAVAEPRPDTAKGAVWGLSDAAARAEENGLALGVDSPDRIRLTDDGRAFLAFPGVSREADARNDVRGLGAVLYALLTGTWPLRLPEGSDAHDPRDGRPGPAPLDDDQPVDPTQDRPGVPQDAAVLAMRSLDGSSVSSAATVRSRISENAGAPARGGPPVGPATGTTAGVGAAAGIGAAAGAGAAASSSSPRRSAPDHSSPGQASAGQAAAGQASSAGASGQSHSGTHAAPDGGPADGPHGPHEGAPEPYTPPDAQKQRRRWMIMAGTGAVAVVAVGVIAASMLGALTGQQNETPLSQQLDAIERAAQQSRSAEAQATATGSPENEAPAEAEAEPEPEEPAPTTPVAVSDVASWQPSSSSGVAENSANAPNVVDDDDSTTWSTDTYRTQLGDGGSAFKPGIGLMFTLDGAQETGRVVLHAEDDGVRFEVRGADSASPGSLDETTLLGEGTVRDGSGAVTVDEPEESEYVLVWITRLASSGPQAFQADVTEVDLTR